MNAKLKEALSTSIYFLCVILTCYLLIKFVGQRTVVIGDSMNDVLVDGDNLILNKISYRFHDPERFDIVIFPFRNDPSKNYIKRVIALPGETIQILEDGTILIDGEVLEENYGREVIRLDRIGNCAEPFELGPDEYFVMGDNRNDSEDSRFDKVGRVKRSEIIGKVWIRVYPFSKFGKIR